MSWDVIPLVADLFVLVEALVHTGVIESLNAALKDIVAASPSKAGWITTLFLAIACNLMNNLPVGLIAGSVIATDHLPEHVAAAAVIAVDLGPNLSVTGSLATILWLAVLRREGESVSGWKFLQLGAMVMMPALLLTMLALTFA
jgi:arsenical pump membrane protein